MKTKAILRTIFKWNWSYFSRMNKTTEVSVRPEWKWKSCVIATCVVKLCIKFTILKRVADGQVHSVFRAYLRLSFFSHSQIWSCGLHLLLERYNPWPRVANRHISISQLLSLWRRSHYDVIRYWDGHAQRYRCTTLSHTSHNIIMTLHKSLFIMKIEK